MTATPKGIKLTATEKAKLEIVFILSALKNTDKKVHAEIERLKHLLITFLKNIK